PKKCRGSDGYDRLLHSSLPSELTDIRCSSKTSGGECGSSGNVFHCRAVACRAAIERILGCVESDARLCAAQNHVVAMHHRGAAFNAEDQLDVARRLADDLGGVLGIVGNEAAPDLGAVRSADHHGIAATEAAVDTDDAG